jgi:DNA topoisomerase IB
MIAVGDPAVRAAITTMKRRRGGGSELLSYREGGTWRDVTSGDINEYVKGVVGGEVSAKDFRTWHGTVLAAVALAVSTNAADTPTARKRPSPAPCKRCRPTWATPRPSRAPRTSTRA